MTAVTHWPVGIVPTNLAPGDLGLVADHKPSVNHEFIQSRERVEFGHTAWANLTHAFCAETSDGTILEELGHGLVRNHIEKYRGMNFYVVHVDATPQQRTLCVERWQGLVGTPYDYTQIVSQFFQGLFGLHVSFSHFRSFICSGAWCYGALAFLVDFPIAFASMTPAHLGMFFELDMGEPPQPLSIWGRGLNLLATAGHVIARLF